MDDSGFPGLVVRRAVAADAEALAGVDPIASEGDPARRASIRRWCGQGSVLLAEDASGPVGYAVLEYTFFEQGFLTLLMVGSHARRRGVGRRLLGAVEAACTTPKLFTSANVSNQPMHQLLIGAGWCPAGLVHGLDEGDPELFYFRPENRLGGQ